MIVAAAVLALGPFRYERTLHAPRAAVVELEPDGPLYAHAARDLADLRVVDARGHQVPWREAPEPPAVSEQPLPVLDRGRRGAFAVARVRTSTPVDRVTLVVPDRRFVGAVAAYGSIDGRVWTRVATSQIYSVGGAEPARSTTVLLPRNDFRYLELRATKVARIDGVLVNAVARTPLRRIPAHGTTLIDLGYANTPVDEIRVTATTPRYDRPFTLLARDATVTGRLRGTTIVEIHARTRYLRLRIDNGDDPPLRGLRVTAYAHPRPLLVEGGHPQPLTVYYGARVAPPVYDFARLPVLARPIRGVLGPEHANPSFRLVDRRSAFARHHALVTAALAAAAALLVAAGALALRRS